MSTSGVISLERDTPELARTYEQAGILQFHHGKFLVGPLALKAGNHVLDIGAGTGRLTEFVAQLVGPDGRVTGIDPLENRIAIARLRASKTLTFAIGRAEDLSRFEPAEFDAVYLNSVFHWISDKRRALHEIHRVLKPGGRIGLNVQDPNLTSPALCFGRRPNRLGSPRGVVKRTGCSEPPTTSSKCSSLRPVSSITEATCVHWSICMTT